MSFNNEINNLNNQEKKGKLSTGIVGIPILAVSLLIILLSASQLFNFEDGASFYLWVLAFAVFGIIGRPLALQLFPRSLDHGWIYGIGLGLLVSSFITWTLAYLGLAVFTNVFTKIIVVVLAIIAVSVLYIWTRSSSKNEANLSKFETTNSWESTLSNQLITTIVFVAAFLFWTYIRSFQPEIYGLEKPMDYGFMSSMWRTDTLPAADMWLANNDINYYYYGQYIFTFIAKLTGARPEIAYNLSISASFALTFGLAFALVRDALALRSINKYDQDRCLEAGVRSDSNLKDQVLPNIGGLLGALLMTVAGNSHAFFYNPDKAGHGFTQFLSRMGVAVGDIYDFYFSDSTRFIGHNPARNDLTIHEFPYYSYLVADLHAHMINLSFVILFLAVLLAFVYHFKDQDNKLSEYKSPYIWTLAFLLGIFTMTNYWDFAIYLVVSMITLFMLYSHGQKSSGGFKDFVLFIVQIAIIFIPFLLIDNSILQLLAFILACALAASIHIKFDSAWTKIGLTSAVLFVISHLIALLFNMNLTSMPMEIGLVNKTSRLYELFILWLFHIGVGLIFVFHLLTKSWNRIKKNWQNQSFLAAILSVNRFDLFIFILTACAFGLILAPEFIYVKDIYVGDYERANTMFKFTYQSFAMLSIVIAYYIVGLLQEFIPDKLLNKTEKEEEASVLPEPSAELRMPGRYSGDSANTDKRNWDWKLLPIILVLTTALIIPFSYTGSLEQWYGDIKPENSLGLEGTSYYGTLYAQDIHNEYHSLEHRLNMIYYLNSEVDEQVNILEAEGPSYSEYGIVSAYTGLPTVLGWHTHQWLWRTESLDNQAYYTVVLPLEEEIRNFYQGESIDDMLDFVAEHDITYIIVGELERIRYINIDEDTLQLLGDIVYQSANDYIIESK